MTRRLFVISYRWIIAALVVAAIITQLAHTVGLKPPGSVANFFSFFTIEANIIAVVVFVIGAIPGREPDSRWYDLARGAAATYMSVTGVVYAVLLSDLPVAADSTIPWVNEVLHYLMPLVVFLDWLFVPPKYVIRFRESLTWAAFPLLYAIYSLIRGAATELVSVPVPQRRHARSRAGAGQLHRHRHRHVPVRGCDRLARQRYAQRPERPPVGHDRAQRRVTRRRVQPANRG